MSNEPSAAMLQILGALSLAPPGVLAEFHEVCHAIRDAAQTEEPEVGRLAAMYVALELTQESNKGST